MKEYIDNFMKVEPELLPLDYLNSSFSIPAGEMVFIGLKEPRKNSRAVCYNVTLDKLQTMSKEAVNFQIRRARKQIKKVT